MTTDYESLISVDFQAPWPVVTVQPTTFSWPLGRTILRTARRALKDTPGLAVLVDIRQVGGSVSTTQRFLLGTYGALLRFPGPVAMVADERLVDPERFGAVVARSRGVQVEVFTDIEKARQWLTTTKGPKA